MCIKTGCALNCVYNWKSAQAVNSHIVCDPTSFQPGFDLPRQQWSLLNRFRTEHGHCGVCRKEWQLTDTDLCAPVARPRRRPTLSNPVSWQNWMAAYLSYTLRMRTLFRGWSVMVHDKHTRRKRMVCLPRHLYRPMARFSLPSAAGHLGPVLLSCVLRQPHCQQRQHPLHMFTNHIQTDWHTKTDKQNKRWLLTRAFKVSPLFQWLFHDQKLQNSST